jgi:hypothetical protein
MSTLFTSGSSKPVKPSDDVSKVIDWPMFCPLEGVPVTVANQLRLVNDGLISRIYLLMPLVKKGDQVLVSPQAITLKLKGILGLKNVAFSVRSIKRTRMLVSASYFNRTLKPPSLPNPGMAA